MVNRESGIRNMRTGLTHLTHIADITRMTPASNKLDSGRNLTLLTLPQLANIFTIFIHSSLIVPLFFPTFSSGT
jgi:hypothetical protein